MTLLQSRFLSRTMQKGNIEQEDFFPARKNRWNQWKIIKVPCNFMQISDQSQFIKYANSNSSSKLIHKSTCRRNTKNLIYIHLGEIIWIIAMAKQLTSNDWEKSRQHHPPWKQARGINHKTFVQANWMPQENNLLFGPLNLSSSSICYSSLEIFFLEFQEIFLCGKSHSTLLLGWRLFKGLKKEEKHMLQAISRVFKLYLSKDFRFWFGQGNEEVFDGKIGDN